jgi:hypothetical protein
MVVRVFHWDIADEYLIFVTFHLAEALGPAVQGWNSADRGLKVNLMLSVHFKTSEKKILDDPYKISEDIF